MKRAVISLLATAFALSGLAAETNQTALSSSLPQAAPASDTGIVALRRASEANQYLFVFFYEKEDDATRAARKTFDEAVKKIAPAPRSVVVDRAAAGEKEIVQQFGVDRAPMPLVLAIAPNGAVTGGFRAADLTEQRLVDSVATPSMQQCLKALQERRLVFVCLQNGRTDANEAAMKGVNEFKADARFAEATTIVKLDPSDPKELKFLAQLKADPNAKLASTAFLAPPGVILAKVDGPTSKDNLVAALTKAMASCGSGCSPSGCGSAPQK
ncbi:MAG: hypothetical protein ABS95_00410 [Verrucomicrobia bacterium SCN 57-15]|nr:MAG: hypothetical protein ABS95_00410 [Verrucomicrobia bacterium SCN 57-15]